MFKSFNPKNTLIALSLICLLVATDLITKKYIINFLFHTNMAVYPVCKGFNLVIVFNRGISFGLFQNYAFSNIIFIILSSCIAISIFIYAILKTRGLKLYSFIIITGGAIGNIYDRIYVGAVRDFLDFYIKDYHWPAFNMADSFICIGAVLYLINSMIKK